MIFLLLPSARAEWTAAAWLGGAHTNDTSLGLQIPALSTNLALHPISYATRPFHSPIYYGYGAGWFFSRHFGFEAEFTHLKVYAETNRTAQISGTLRGAPINETAVLDNIVQQFNITHGVNLLTASFAARKAFHGGGGSPRLIVSARAGGGITIPHPENEVLGVSNSEHYQVGSPVIQFAAGFEVRLWRRFYGITEVRYTRVGETVSIAQGNATSVLDTSHATFGLAWHF